MKWVTRQNAKVDRIACPWLIRKLIDPGAEFLYVPADEVLATADREGGLSYDAPGARFTHRDGKCTFEVLIEEHGLGGDPALDRLARLVHAADVSADVATVPEGAGLKAVAEGFALLVPDDHEKLERELPVYDALYAWCRAKAGAGAGAASTRPAAATPLQQVGPDEGGAGGDPRGSAPATRRSGRR